jgi:hypothetical protein
MVLGVGLMVLAPVFGVACDPAAMETLQTMSNRSMVSATVAVGRASEAGQGEATLLQEFLSLSQARLEAAANAVEEIRALTERVAGMVGRVSAVSETIARGGEGDPALAALASLASALDQMTRGALSKVQGAVRDASQALEKCVP